MRETNSLLCLWDYCVERRARINNLTAKNAFKLHGSTPHTVTTGNEGDISNLCQYGWYEWCYFRDQTAAFPNKKEVLGRVLGPARGAGNEMAQWILKSNGRIIYDVEFPDGQVKEYAANIIAENMLTQVDSDGMSTTLMEAIVDHRRDDEKALQHHDKYVQTKDGRRHLRKTTKGWELLINWKDKSESWIKLADMSHIQLKLLSMLEPGVLTRSLHLNGGPSYSLKEASHPISTQEENQKDYTQVWH